MGEKETMTGAEAREAGSGMATGRRGVTTAREAGSGLATGRVAAGDVDGDGAADIAAPREHGSGMATGRREDGISHEDTWDQQGRLAGGAGTGGAPAGIAIGDPGVNGNLTGDAPGIAIDEPGVQVAGMRPADPIPDLDGSGPPPSPEETAIVKSKSNITNN